jgi:hypothetical protein
MRRTRLSLYYLAGYLIPTGVALLFAPRETLALLFARYDYGDIFPRFVGLLLLGLGIVVAQLIRLRVEALYPTTILVRVLFCLGFTALYLRSGDRLFLVILGVVGLGLLLTSLSYLVDYLRPRMAVVTRNS